MKPQRTINSKGFTLVETLAAVLIIVMLGSVVGVGVQAAIKTYQDLTFVEESDLLASTIHVAASDIFRYAQPVEPSATDPTVRFSNMSYGISKGYMFLKEDRAGEGGKLMIALGDESGGDGDLYSLVNDGAYTTMKIKDFTIQYDGKGVYTGGYTIVDASGGKSKKEAFTFRTLKVRGGSL